jgi:hypothetical protein
VIKKNRKYFACTHNGYNVKLLVDENSDGLNLGEQELLVNDISVRSKYGTDVIYSLYADCSTQKKDAITTLKHGIFNVELVKKCKELGGRFDEEEDVWVFNTLVQSEVEDLDTLYNDDIVNIEIVATDELYKLQGPITFCGYVIAKASGRDSGAKLGYGVAMMEGKIDSSGSAKNWRTYIEIGSRFRLQVSKNLLDDNKNNDKFECKII